MRVLIVNDSSERMRLAHFYEQAFRHLQIDVSVLDLFYPSLDRSRSSAAKGRLMNRWLRCVWSLQDQTRSRLMGALSQFRPEMVLVTGAIRMPADLLDEARKQFPAVKFCNLLTDPFPVSDDCLRAAIPAYDCIFTFSRFQVALLYWFHARKVVWLPFAMAPEVHRPVQLTAAEAVYYGSPVAYMGTWQPFADIWLEQIATKDLKIWGNQWGRSVNPSVKAKWQGMDKGLYDEMAKIVTASRITFNMVRYHNGNGHSMKTFEIPACGGFMLTNRTDEQIEFFPEDEGAVYYSTAEELRDKLAFYLREDGARKRIADRGLQIVQHHTYRERARQILNVFNASRD